MKRLLLLILIFLNPYFCYSAPVISGIVGSPAEGESVEINGSGFTTNGLDIHWLGGENGVIESGTPDAEISLPAGWEVDATSSARQRPLYSTTEKWSGDQSMKSYFPQESQYTSGYVYEQTGEFSSVYVTYWFFGEPISWEDGFQPDDIGQFKLFRITSGLAPIYQDQRHNWYWSQQFDGTSNPPIFEDGHNLYLNFCLDEPTPEYDINCFGGESIGAGLNRPFHPNTKVWQRIEIWAKQSTPGVMDGTVYVLIHRSQETIPTVPDPWIDHIDNTQTRETTNAPWKYVVFENFFGNGVNEGNFYLDDILLQFNSQARVEIGNNPVFADSTYREVQIPTTWEPGKIDVIINRGNFPDGQAYLFVIDENGVASEGSEIDIGEAAGGDITITGGVTLGAGISIQ